MVSRRLAVAVGLALLTVAAGGLLAVHLGAFSELERATVTVVDENGTTLARVDVWVADTYAERYTGLSETASLATGEGMLFVHPSEDTHAYVMRGMDYGLDIVFVDANGTITRIHHAEAPPPGASGSALERYRGRGKYVLEVPYGYTNQTGIDVGDRVRIPPAHRKAEG